MNDNSVFGGGGGESNDLDGSVKEIVGLIEENALTQLDGTSRGGGMHVFGGGDGDDDDDGMWESLFMDSYQWKLNVCRGMMSADDFRNDGASSSSTGGGRREEFDDRGGGYKRARFHANTLEDYRHTTIVSSNSHEDQKHNPTNSSLFNDDRNENPVGYGRVRDIEGGGATPTTEESQVQMDITGDLLHTVFSFLGRMDLCRAAMVCSQWRAASSHEDFWRCLNFEYRSITMFQFENILQRYPNAIEVNIFGCPSIHSLGMRAFSILRNLKSLTLGKGQLRDPFFHALAAECTTLKSLDINDCTLGNGMQEVSILHDRLRHLHITKCRVHRISVKCPQLEILSLKRSNMGNAVLNCPILKDLDISSCHKLSDVAIRTAATSCSLLESLDISICSCVSDETVREIGNTCTNLHILNASYCPHISLESVRLPMLTVLKLHSCEGITSASMVAISNSYTLEVLELVNCNLLTSVSLELPRLLNIRLVHCRKFVDLNLQSVKLTSITVSNCPLLNKISIVSKALQKLVLQKIVSLTTLALQCSSLQEVDLTDCESLTNAVCEVFSDGSGCPILKSLILDNCESMTAVRLCSTLLVNLSLVGCRGVSVLELKSPNLEKVDLDGCDHLERASFCPVGLKSLNLGICPKLNELHIEAPEMLVLELKGCGVLAKASINCPLLTSLDASFCCQLKDECLAATTVACPLTESLILMSCPSVGSDGLSSLRWLPNLTFLDLSYTFLVNLQPVFNSCVELRVLKLQACKYLAASFLEPLYKEGALPSLRELDLSNVKLHQSAIEELLAHCKHLTHVNLSGCENVHDLNWDYSSNSPSDSDDGVVGPDRLLQDLKCVGCPNIRKVFIPPTARCFHLSSLNLSLSANLKEVVITCHNLSFLNLSNCCSLEILVLDCSKLATLFLQSCTLDEGTIQRAISGCTVLETLDIRFCPKIYQMSLGRLRAACPSLKRVYTSLSS